eukprot:s6322_g1.t3
MTQRGVLTYGSPRKGSKGPAKGPTAATPAAESRSLCLPSPWRPLRQQRPLQLLKLKLQHLSFSTSGRRLEMAAVWPLQLLKLKLQHQRQETGDGGSLAAPTAEAEASAPAAGKGPKGKAKGSKGPAKGPTAATPAAEPAAEKPEEPKPVPAESLGTPAPAEAI